MKISEMTTEQAADVLVKIAEPAATIMQDEKVVQVLEKVATASSDNAVKFFADYMPMVVSVLIKDHKTEVYKIIAALSGKTAKAIAGQKITETIKDIKDCVDGDLVDFLGSLK